MLYVSIFFLGFVAWLVNAITAGGAGIIFLPLARLILPTTVVPPTMSIAGTISGIHRTWLYRAQINWKITRWMLPGTILGAIVGSYLFSLISVNWLDLFVGIFLVIVPLGYFLKFKAIDIPSRIEYFFPASFFSSLISGVVGASGPIINSLYLKCKIPKEQIIATKAFGILSLQLVKAFSYASFAPSSLDYIKYGLVAGMGGAAGNYLGKLVLFSIKDKTFEDIVNMMILISGISLLVRHLSQ